MNEKFNIPPYLRQIMIIAVIFIAILGMKFTAPILGLVMLSIFISLIIYPLFKMAGKQGYLL